MPKQILRIFTLLAVYFYMCLTAFPVNMKVDYNTIPKPCSIEYAKSEVYVFDYTSYITYPESRQDIECYAVMLQDYIEQMTGVVLEVGIAEDDEAEERSIHLDIDKDLAPEEYRINVCAQLISITSGSNRSLCYGVQYMRKLFTPISPFTVGKGLTNIDDFSNATLAKTNNSLSLDFPAASIVCRPRMETRKIVLDERYQHISNSEFLTIIDIISLHGYNQLQISQSFNKQQIEYALLNGIEIVDDTVDCSSHFYSEYPAQWLLNHSKIPSSYYVNYKDDFDGLVSQLLPNIALLSEHQWNNTEDFNQCDVLYRLEMMCQLYEHYGRTYSEELFGIITETEVDTTNKKISLKLFTNDRTPVYYSIEGEDPMLFTNPIEIKKSCEITLTCSRKLVGTRQYIADIDFNRATLQQISCDKKYLYADSVKNDIHKLVDALKSSDKYPLNQWVKLCGKEILLDITFDKIYKINTIEINNLISEALGACEIDNIKILVSSDSESYSEVYSTLQPYSDIPRNRHNIIHCKFKSQKAKSVRIILSPAENNISSFIAIDEILIR